MYHKGHGVERDDAEAVKWFSKAAEQGNAFAQFNLGILKDNGLGVSPDNAEAVMWYYRAAEQGVAEAQYNLGLMYGNGEGVCQDFILAHMWFNIAAKGYEKAKQGRDIAASKMTPDQIAEAQRMARDWMAKHQQ